MNVFLHPQRPDTHVVLDVAGCPEMFRMLTEVAGARDAVRHEPQLGGFVMTLDLYQRLRHGLQNASSLRDLVGLCPSNTPPIEEPPASAPAAPPHLANARCRHKPRAPPRPEARGCRRRPSG